MRLLRNMGFIAALGLAGCSDQSSGVAGADQWAPEGRTAATMIAPAAVGGAESVERSGEGFSPPAEKRGARIAYTHNIAITVAPPMVAAHFNGLKKLCLEDEALRCTLLDASASLNDVGLSWPTAHIQARLPHESVGRFVSAVTTAVEGERPEDLVVQRSATRMDEIGGQIADSAARLEQLESYRKRLLEIESGRNARVEDLIRVAEELSKVQSQIEALRGSHRRLEERADTELVGVYIESARPAGGSFAPVSEVWKKGAAILGRSTAAALRFVLAAIPWAIVVAGFGSAAVWLLRLLLLRLKQKGA